MKRLKINEKRCTGCTQCILVCPINLQIEPKLKQGVIPPKKDSKTDLIMRVINGKTTLIHPEYCYNKDFDFECERCVKICPTGAFQIIDEE
ncbi:MAG: 4Fe-4S dicluster domain-containing protein [Candidatus Lokiarchaeota archaeon]|nr:4Fe-4S dicluster domain-containing protein [Candidatus Lokiarchaeota archaeon]